MTSRQARSTSAHATPARPPPRRRPGWPGPRRPPGAGRGRSTASTQTVRVMSEQYPSNRAPKSITTGSAGRITPRARAVVGHGRVGTAGDDGLERRAAGAQPPHLEVQAPAERLLGRTASQLRADAVQGLVGDAGRLGQAGQLARVLDPAQPLDEPDGWHQFDAREPVVGVKRLLPGPADVGGLEAEAPDAGGRTISRARRGLVRRAEPSRPGGRPPRGCELLRRLDGRSGRRSAGPLVRAARRAGPPIR